MSSALFLLADAAASGPPLGVWVVIVGGSVGAAVIAAALRSRGDQRATGLLARWAAAQGLTMIRQEIIPGQRGPFAMRGYWTTVYRITARQPDGAERSAWVCMNNFFVWGGGAPDVVWDA